MARIATRAEREFDYLAWGQTRGIQQVAENRGAPASVRITAAISAAAWRAANDAGATAIIACTNSGTTARAISRFRPVVPGPGRHAVAADRPPALGGVGDHPDASPSSTATTDDIVWFAVKAAVDSGVVKKGDIVAVLVGSPDEPEPTTDVLRLVRIYRTAGRLWASAVEGAHPA